MREGTGLIPCIFLVCLRCLNVFLLKYGNIQIEGKNSKILELLAFFWNFYFFIFGKFAGFLKTLKKNVKKFFTVRKYHPEREYLPPAILHRTG